MNERIIELAAHAKAYANQCTKDIDGDVSWHWMEYYTEKFAELIVQECVSVINTEAGEREDDDEYERAWKMGTEFAVYQIKQHFGVEE